MLPVPLHECFLQWGDQPEQCHGFQDATLKPHNEIAAYSKTSLLYPKIRYNGIFLTLFSLQDH